MNEYKAEDCMYFNAEAKSHRCQMKVHDRAFNGLYNCKKKGICKLFKLLSTHELECKIRNEERDKKEYLRLKKKYDVKLGGY